MAHYGRTDYWQQRYSRDGEAFDWYHRYFALRDVIGEHVPVQDRILNVGAGNSRMSEEMFEDGYENMTNIDISLVCKNRMNERLKDKGANFRYLHMDVRAMEFGEGSFDTVIDKACFDSVVCGQGTNANAQKMLSQIYRVLATNGKYIMISFANPENRLHFLQKPQFEWWIKTYEIPKPTVAATITPPNKQQPWKNNYYIYVCTKGKQPVQTEPEPEPQPQGKVPPQTQQK